jgi:curved DNA-binding protein CbpA
MTIDYYAILGVLPSAEDVVIRAAYRALANRYHPDKFEGSANEATRRMQEINAAYAILSEPTKRSEYDKVREVETQDGDSYFGSGSDDAPPQNDPLEAEWAVAVKYFPDLVELESRLARIAWRLGYSYRAFMITEKAFPKRVSVADAMEMQFLQTYFGTNPQILAFAKILVNLGERAAAKALHESVKVFGSTIEPNRVIAQIKAEYLPNLFRAEQEEARRRTEQAEMRRRTEEVAQGDREARTPPRQKEVLRMRATPVEQTKTGTGFWNYVWALAVCVGFWWFVISTDLYKFTVWSIPLIVVSTLYLVSMANKKE